MSSPRLNKDEIDTDMDEDKVTWWRHSTVLLCLQKSHYHGLLVDKESHLNNWWFNASSKCDIKQYSLEDPHKQVWKITCKNVSEANLRGLNPTTRPFILLLTAVKNFTSVPPSCLDSLVNPVLYSLPEPIIFHSHSHFWIGNSKGVLAMNTHWQANACTYSRTNARTCRQCAVLVRRAWSRLQHELCSDKSCYWNIVLLLVSWQRAGRVPVLSQCEFEGAMGRLGSPSVSAQQSQCAEIMPIRLGQSRPSTNEIWPFHSFHTIIHTPHCYPSSLWKMSATVIAFIYDTFFKLMTSHVVTLHAEKA